jgi:serine/threonine protein kinase
VSSDGTGQYKVGQLPWVAPEQLDPESYPDIQRSKRDVWAVGVLVYMLLCGKMPFAGNSDTEITASIKYGL